jgi:hypothetical protein
MKERSSADYADSADFFAKRQTDPDRSKGICVANRQLLVFLASFFAVVRRRASNGPLGYPVGVKCL